MTKQTLFSFEGTIDRLPYFLYPIGLALVLGAVVAASSLLGETAVVLAAIPAVIAFIWSSLAIITKRIRATGMDVTLGWCMLIGFSVLGGVVASSTGMEYTVADIPSLVLNLYLLFKPTQVEDN